MVRLLTCMVTFCLFSLVSWVWAQPNAPLASSQTDTPPRLDGVLDDAVWQTAPFMTGFQTYTPSFGQPMTHETKAYFAHDAENLYYALRCYDGEPDKIKASLAKRDQIRSDDWICINLDSFNDQQALYGLYVNPLGIQADTRFANDNEDDGFDMVWYSAGKIDAEGYVIEVRIPLKSLRFSGRERVEMGVIFERRIDRFSQQGTSPPLAPAQGMSFLTQMQTIVYNDLHQDHILELLPAVTYNYREAREDGQLRERDKGEELSLTAKYGLTSQLILDATYNPDFNQVEADAGQVDVNLRTALFFTEKRPFFQEGSESFNFAANGPGNRIGTVVHTRNIVDPEWGLKLNGKVGRLNNLAVLGARDEVDPDDPTDFEVVRYKRQLARGKDDYVGGVYTSREDSVAHNRVLGLDGAFRLTPGSTFEFYGLGSRTETAGLADSDGDAYALLYKSGTRERELSFGVNHIDEDFRLDSGYVSRTGITSYTARYNPRWFPKSGAIQRVVGELVSIQSRDEPSGLWETDNTILGQMLFQHTRSIRLRYRYATEVFLGQEFDVDNAQVQWSDRPVKQLSYVVAYTESEAIYYSEAPFQGRRHIIQSDWTYQPDERWNFSLSYLYSDFYRKQDDVKIFQYPLTRLRATFQTNRYLFLRAIGEYNGFRKTLLTDFLASFTYIPGTVMHLGYGSLYQRRDALVDPASERSDFLEAERGFFFKASYLWRK